MVSQLVRADEAKEGQPTAEEPSQRSYFKILLNGLTCFGVVLGRTQHLKFFAGPKIVFVLSVGK